MELPSICETLTRKDVKPTVCVSKPLKSVISAEGVAPCGECRSPLLHVQPSQWPPQPWKDFHRSLKEKVLPQQSEAVQRVYLFFFFAAFRRFFAMHFTSLADLLFFTDFSPLNTFCFFWWESISRPISFYWPCEQLAHFLHRCLVPSSRNTIRSKIKTIK